MCSKRKGRKDQSIKHCTSCKKSGHYKPTCTKKDTQEDDSEEEEEDKKEENIYKFQ